MLYQLTVTRAALAALAAAIVVIKLSFTMNEVAAAVPNRTLLTFVSLNPTSKTTLPPATGPVLGINATRIGPDNWAPLLRGTTLLAVTALASDTPGLGGCGHPIVGANCS